jgi:hypothetical protein
MVMAKAPAGDSIMAAAQMKPLLALSKQEPVQAAIGLTANGEGLILLDKRAKPKRVFSMLKAGAAKAKLQLNAASLRFGRAEVDTDYDPGMVRFFVNKDAPGNLRLKLVEVVKRIPYQKVEINVDRSLELEPEEDDAHQPETAPAPAAEQPLPVPPAAPPPPAAPRQDIAGLRRILEGLIGRISETAGDDAARKAQLVALAVTANNAVKAEDLRAAATSVKELSNALAASPAAPPQADAAGSPLAIWTDAKDQVDSQLSRLYQLLREPGITVFTRVADEIENVLGSFRTGLITALLDFDRANARDRDARRKAVLDVVADYRSRLGTDPHVIAADTNPLGVPITARDTLGAALDHIEQQMAAT